MTEWKFNDLLLKIKQGNKAAFDTLYKEYYPKMLFTANNITNNIDDAKDAVQTAFLKLWKYIIDSDKTSAKYFDSYLYTIARNAALDIVTSRNLFEISEDVETMTADVYSEDSVITYMDIQTAIRGLKEPEQTVAVQFFLFNMKIKEIAKYLNEPVGTVKWRISEIKKYFEKVLK